MVVCDWTKLLETEVGGLICYKDVPITLSSPNMKNAHTPKTAPKTSVTVPHLTSVLVMWANRFTVNIQADVFLNLLLIDLPLLTVY